MISHQKNIHKGKVTKAKRIRCKYCDKDDKHEQCSVVEGKAGIKRKKETKIENNEDDKDFLECTECEFITKYGMSAESCPTHIPPHIHHSGTTLFGLVILGTQVHRVG